MLIRRATIDDADTIATLLGELGYPTAAESVPPRLRILEKEESPVFVAVGADDTPLGLAAATKHAGLHTDESVAYITALVTSSGARGQGVGRALVGACEAWAREQGCGRLSVTSAERRADAHAFYPSCGLPYTGRRFAKVLEPPP
jgi:GNAT superfamily N-acetyltransferase